MKSSSKAVGKNFSCNNASGMRKKSDFYETPFSLTRLLLENEDFSKCNSILEPACGNGAIVHVLKEYGLKAGITAYDREVDFLKEEKKYSCAITNPPFSLAKEFILKAKQVCTTKFAFLLPLSYLHGKERFDLIYSDTKYPLKKVWIFTRYPLLGEDLRADGKMNTGMMVYAWVVWQKRYKGEPTLGWLDNDKYVLRKVIKQSIS
jgi:hypothetical protein